MIINNLHKISFRFIQFVIGFVFLAFLTACGDNSSKSTQNKAIISVPTALQKFAVDGGTLSAFIVIDNDVLNPIQMDINNEGAGSASVIIPNLTRANHNIVIT